MHQALALKCVYEAACGQNRKQANYPNASRVHLPGDRVIILQENGEALPSSPHGEPGSDSAHGSTQKRQEAPEVVGGNDHALRAVLGILYQRESVVAHVDSKARFDLNFSAHHDPPFRASPTGRAAP